MYPLPCTTKSHFTRWSGKIIQKGALTGYTVVWVGTPAGKRISLHNIHILQKENEYMYAIRKTNTFLRLCNRYIDKFFKKFTLNEIPPGNRCVQCLYDTLVNVPFVPDTVYHALQKKPKQNLKRPRAIVDFDIPYPTWRNNPPRPTIKHRITGSFAKMFTDADTLENYHIPDPFAEFQTMDAVLESEEGRMRYNIVAGFIYHYCRDNLGYTRQRT